MWGVPLVDLLSVSAKYFVVSVQVLYFDRHRGGCSHVSKGEFYRGCNSMVRDTAPQNEYCKSLNAKDKYEDSQLPIAASAVSTERVP